MQPETGNKYFVKAKGIDTKKPFNVTLARNKF